MIYLSEILTNAIAWSERKWVVGIIFNAFFMTKKNFYLKLRKISNKIIYEFSSESGSLINRSGLNSSGFGKNFSDLPLTYDENFKNKL